MSAVDYPGPVSLGNSKYASVRAATSSSSSRASATKATAEQTTATQSTSKPTAEQVTATKPTTMGTVNANQPTAQLVLSHSEDASAQWSAEMTELNRAVTAAIKSTRYTLDDIRKELAKNSQPVDTDKIEHALVNLAAATDLVERTRRAVPEFISQQEALINFIPTSWAAGLFFLSHYELKFLYKMVEVRQSAIDGSEQVQSVRNLLCTVLENTDGLHRQLFNNYKAMAERKVQECVELQERVARLDLEQGDLKSALDKAIKQQEVKNAEADQVAEKLRITTASLGYFKNDSDTMGKTVTELQDHLKASEQKVTQLETEAKIAENKVVQYETEIRRVTEQFGKGSQKSLQQESRIKELRDDCATYKKSHEALKSDMELQKKKYMEQAAEFAKLKDLNVSLKEDLLNSKKQHEDQLKKVLEDLKRNNAELEQQKAALMSQNDKLKAEISDDNKKIHELESTIKKLGHEALSKDAEIEKAKRTITILKGEVSRQHAMIVDLQSKIAADVVNSASTDKIKDMEQELAKWKVLASQAYEEYLAMLKATEARKNVDVDKDQEIAELKRQLQVKPSQTNGTLDDKNTTYWKLKYEALLADM